ncbi:MAG: hypothetical protein JXM70_17465 [Pirellulales bacterium]|nr:hypothetical protein [Pirellulales bacterium]
MNSITIRSKIHFRRGHRNKKELHVGPEKQSAPTSVVPRVARLMALAIRFDQLIRNGVVINQAELARLGHVTRARLTQIMNLRLLAPDIQEAILFLPRVENGRDQIFLRDLQPIALVSDWRKQRRMWRSLKSRV